MSRSRLYSILVHLHRKQQTETQGLPDADLLDRFVRLRDEASFELLVRRHERMVLGVCRRLLNDEHDAEDAFQAAFLTLARKAASIGRREAVASWLYKVAYRCALRVREAVQRQRQGIVRGIDPADVAVADPPPAVEREDLRELLDEEVQRLPAKYRAAVVLCYLEGKSYQQAAQELGCPAGTLSARLHTAREKLRRRLTARGVAPAAALALLESARETHAAARLAAVAVQAAQRILAGQSAADVVSSRTLEIASGVMQTMSASKPKIIAIVLLMGCLSGLTGWAAWRALPHALREPRAEATDKPVSVNKDGKTMTWQECARLRNAGRSAMAWAADGSLLAVVDGERILRVWDTSKWKPKSWQYNLRPRYGEIDGDPWRFAPDGRILVVAGTVPDPEKPGQRKYELTLLDSANGREMARLPGMIAYHGPTTSLISTWHKGSVFLWDAGTFRKKREFKAALPAHVASIPFSKDALLVCLPTGERHYQLWETATGKERARVEGFYPEISPDGKRVLTILPDGIVKLWDTADGRERATIRKKGRTGCLAAFSADGKRLLVWAYIPLRANGTPDTVKNRKRLNRILPIDVCLYDPATGAELARLPGQSLYNVSADFSSDGRAVVYSRLEADETQREEVVLWDVASGKERAVLRTPEGVRNLPRGFSSVGSALLTADGYMKNLRLWDIATGRCILRFPAEVRSVFFSRDGRWLAGKRAFNPNEDPGDIRIYYLSDRTLPPPVVCGEAGKPTSPPQPPPEPPKSEAARALDAVRQQAQKFDEEALPKFKDAKPGPQRGRLEREWAEAHLRFGRQFLKVARDFPTDPASLEALDYALRSVGGHATGEMSNLREEVLAVILREHQNSPELSNLLFRMSSLYADSAEKALTTLAEKSTHRPIRGRAAWRLAETLANKAESSRQIRALPELFDDPELTDRKSYMKDLQKIDPDSVAHSAEEWYVKVHDQYADVPVNDGQKITLGESAESGLFALRNLALGKIAPDIEGEDLDGKRFHLSDCRGKVVVLLFCGHWCGPCRQMNPQKQQLVERYAGEPFALVEVNSDDDREAVKRIMRKEKLTWRCWFDGGREGPIARRWGVHSWPTIFILDSNGVIRFKELRGPMLDRIVERLMRETADGK